MSALGAKCERMLNGSWWALMNWKMSECRAQTECKVNMWTHGERMVNAQKKVKVERFRDCMKSVSIICITSTSKYKCLILFSLWTAGLRSLEEICPSVVSYWAGIYVSISALPSSHSSPEPPWQLRGVTTSHSLPPKDCRTPSQFKPKGEEGIIFYYLSFILAIGVNLFFPSSGILIYLYQFLNWFDPFNQIVNKIYV